MKDDQKTNELRDKFSLPTLPAELNSHGSRLDDHGAKTGFCKADLIVVQLDIEVLFTEQQERLEDSI